MNNTVGAWYAAQIEHTSWGFPKEIPKFESMSFPTGKPPEFPLVFTQAEFS